MYVCMCISVVKHNLLYSLPCSMHAKPAMPYSCKKFRIQTSCKFLKNFVSFCIIFFIYFFISLHKKTTTTTTKTLKVYTFICLSSSVYMQTCHTYAHMYVYKLRFILMYNFKLFCHVFIFVIISHTHTDSQILTLKTTKITFYNKNKKNVHTLIQIFTQHSPIHTHTHTHTRKDLLLQHFTTLATNRINTFSIVPLTRLLTLPNAHNYTYFD